MAIKRWLPLLGLILYLGLILRSLFLIALPVTVVVILLLAAWWQKHALDGVTYRRRFHYTRGFPGEQFPVRLEVENRKLLPLSWIRFQDPWPKAVAPVGLDSLAPSHIPDEGFLTHIFSLRWFEHTWRSYNLLYQKRGVYSVGPVLVESGDLFGFYETRRQIGSMEPLTVFPELAPISQIQMPPEDPFGDRRSRRRLFEDPSRPMGVREYRPEDGFRRIHWPATARTGDLQVKIFQPTSAQVMVLCLNISTYHRYWEGVYPALLERLLSVAAALVEQGLRNGYRVGLISNGCFARSDQPFRVPPSRTPQQLANLLQALAGVSPVAVAPFEKYLLREAPKVSYGSTLVVLSAVNSLELAETLLRLKRHERRLTLVSLAAESPPPIPGVPVTHIPFEDMGDFEPEPDFAVPLNES